MTTGPYSHRLHRRYNDDVDFDDVDFFCWSGFRENFHFFIEYTVGCGILCTFQILWCWRGFRDLSRDNSQNPAGFQFFRRIHPLWTSNIPLDAELSLLFGFHNADVDHVTYHAIILKIQLDFTLFVEFNRSEHQTHRWMRNFIYSSDFMMLTWISWPITR